MTTYKLNGTYMLDDNQKPFKYRRWWQIWKPKRIYAKPVESLVTQKEA